MSQEFRQMKRFLCILVVLMLPAIAFAEYKVVIKKSGRVIEGRYVKEDDKSIYMVSDGIQLTFKKELLDLDKMKSLNPETTTPAEDATNKSGTKSTNKSVADIAKENK